MQQFTSVVREMRKWLTEFEWANFFLPFDIFILFGSLGLMLINEILQLIHFYAPLNVLQAFGYYGFLLGALLTLISHNIKYLPYGLWFYAFLLLFPFSYFSLSGILGAALWAYLGYALMKYTAITDTSF